MRGKSNGGEGIREEGRTKLEDRLGSTRGFLVNERNEGPVRLLAQNRSYITKNYIRNERNKREKRRKKEEGEEDQQMRWRASRSRRQEKQSRGPPLQQEPTSDPRGRSPKPKNEYKSIMNELTRVYLVTEGGDVGGYNSDSAVIEKLSRRSLNSQSLDVTVSFGRRVKFQLNYRSGDCKTVGIEGEEQRLREVESLEKGKGEVALDFEGIGENSLEERKLREDGGRKEKEEGEEEEEEEEEEKVL